MIGFTMILMYGVRRYMTGLERSSRFRSLRDCYGGVRGGGSLSGPGLSFAKVSRDD
jgi:hypothetical protein